MVDFLFNKRQNDIDIFTYFAKISSIFNKKRHIYSVVLPDFSILILYGVFMSDGEPLSNSELEQILREIVAGPKKVSGDAGSVEQHSIGDLIEADKYLSSKEAAKSRGFGIKLTRIEPDGTA